jgi:predicted ATPase
MITRIEIDGFKSFSKFELDLEPFVVLIGPNGAGKSNLVDALGLLERLSAQDFASAFAGGRGRMSEQFARRDARAPGDARLKGELSLFVELLLLNDSVLGVGERVPLKATRLRYEIEIEVVEVEGGLQQILLRRERLAGLRADTDRWMDAHPHLGRYARYVDGAVLLSYDRSQLVIDDPSAPEQRVDATVQYAPSGAYLSPRSSAAGRSPHLLAVGQELFFHSSYRLDPEALRAPSERGARLLPSGANLPTALAAMGTEGQAWVRADFTALVPGVRNFNVVPEGDRLEVEVELLDGQRFSARILSEGTLRMLGLAALLRLSPPGHLIAVEEPENGVHPARLRTLFDRLRQASEEPEGTEAPASGAPPENAAPRGRGRPRTAAEEISSEGPRQILVTTHSLVVLASALRHPNEIVFCDMVRRGGVRRTRARLLAPQGAEDRGEHFASIAEVERLLDAARLEPTDEA